MATLEWVRIEEFIYSSRGFPGRPPEDRIAIARAFVAKMIYNMPMTHALLDRLETDSVLKRIEVGNVKTMSPVNGHSRGHFPSSRNPNYLTGFMPCLSKKVMPTKSWA